MGRNNTNTFYSQKVKKATLEQVSLLTKYLENHPVLIEPVIHRLRPFWPEFSKWWSKRTGEHLDWVTFALRVHNTHWFLTWAATCYPEVKQYLDSIRHEWNLLLPNEPRLPANNWYSNAEPLDLEMVARVGQTPKSK